MYHSIPSDRYEELSCRIKLSHAYSVKEKQLNAVALSELNKFAQCDEELQGYNAAPSNTDSTNTGQLNTNDEAEIYDEAHHTNTAQKSSNETDVKLEDINMSDCANNSSPSHLLCKKLFFKIALVCHPDKSMSNHFIQYFNMAKEANDSKQIVPLCLILVKVSYDQFVQLSEFELDIIEEAVQTFEQEISQAQNGVTLGKKWFTMTQEEKEHHYKQFVKPMLRKQHKSS